MRKQWIGVTVSKEISEEDLELALHQRYSLERPFG